MQIRFCLQHYGIRNKISIQNILYPNKTERQQRKLIDFINSKIIKLIVLNQ